MVLPPFVRAAGTLLSGRQQAWITSVALRWVEAKRRRRPAWTLDGPFSHLAQERSDVRHVLDTLERAGLAPVVVPSNDGYARHIAVEAEVWTEAQAALKALRKSDGWTATSRRGRKAVRLERNVMSSDGVPIPAATTHVTVAPWKLLHGSGRVPGTRGVNSHAHVCTHVLGPEDWSRLRDQRELALAGLLDGMLPLRIPEGPIDVVYTWVNNADPTWQAARAQAQASAEISHPSAVDDARFLDFDELRYSLRSLEMYADWVNHVYIVTAGQVPEWLSMSHPQVTVVDHRSIFADSTVLPTFNSHAIEAQLHRIPGLSERYLYMNDDVFFGRPVSPSTFFTGGGLPKIFTSESTVGGSQPAPGDLPVVAAAKRNRELMAAEFGTWVGRKYRHTPHAQLKSVLEDIERAHPEAISAVTERKFRHHGDVSLASSLHHSWAYRSGRAVESDVDYVYVDLDRADRTSSLNKLRLRHPVQVFCLNQVELKHRDEVEVQLAEALEKSFPQPSSYENEGR